MSLEYTLTNSFFQDITYVISLNKQRMAIEHIVVPNGCVTLPIRFVAHLQSMLCSLTYATQFAHYGTLLGQDPELAQLVKAVINNEARYVSQYPYCE